MTACHRPAVRKRRNRHDTYSAVDLFSGFGGISWGIRHAGFDLITAANHNAYKVEVHEANHPEAEHWIADLVDRDAADYHSVRDLPSADLLAAGVSCVNHSQANTQKAYAQGMSLFDLDDPDYEARVTRSERDRATANCVLHYAAQHHPRLILVECTTELQSWGNLVPGKRKVGDGATYRWWLNEIQKLGYRYRELYLNSMFFGVPQSRDRLYICFWDRTMPSPNLDHRPQSWCDRCEAVVEAVWTWKTSVTPTGSVRYGKQYNYRCPSCRSEVFPPATPSLHALDLTDLGTRIGDRKRPLAPATLTRAERCLQRFGEFPAVLMPAKAQRGSERHPWQPMATQTSQQETGLLSASAVMQTNSTALLTPPIAMAVDNFQGAARGPDQPLPTQGGSETMALLAGVLPYRRNTTPTVHAEPMPTVTADQVPGLLTAAGVVQFNQGVDRRLHGVDRPLRTQVADNHMGLLTSGWYKQNGSTGTETAPHPVLDPFGTLTSRDTTALLTAEWRNALADLTLDDCYFRMLFAHEVGRGCGFDVTFGDYQGSFKVWGSARNQVDGYGNAVSPAVSWWICDRLRAVLHSEPVAA